MKAALPSILRQPVVSRDQRKVSCASSGGRFRRCFTGFQRVSSAYRVPQLRPLVTTPNPLPDRWRSTMTGLRRYFVVGGVGRRSRLVIEAAPQSDAAVGAGADAGSCAVRSAGVDRVP